ncbi:sigma 54-interacting transcriptional regulator [Sorangium sp. So ce321]|uniref:sigma 54-interacting transcriptional regulator n=1 Tax=Sorangium sp. So ce321 TaxID=3133300 RepID=UPI003F60885A
MLGPQDRVKTTHSLAADQQPEPDTFHFMVVEQTSSRIVGLPPAGFLLVGRSPEADIHLDDPAASRRHAKVMLQGGAVRIMDLDSRNGLRVNGAPIDGACALVPGDVVSIGEVSLILRGRPKPRHAGALLDEEALLDRLAHEVERGIEYARPLCVAVIAERPIAERSGVHARARAGSSPALASFLDDAAVVALRERAIRAVDIVGRTAGGELCIVFPELDADEARAAAVLALESLAARSPGARAGVAAYPADGCDAETLLAAARDTCRATEPGAVAGGADRVRSLALGDRVVVLADPAMMKLFSLIERLADAHLPVLVVGETGAGKEHAAFAVHHGSSRRAGPFVCVNCAAIPDTLFESEFFGHQKGAFSGAHAAQAGLFERADGGTLFLDEVGELSLSAQAKLLRVLEDGRFARLGEAREREADVRLVAATNRDLAAEVKARRFREDLFYRLSSAVVMIPPLRERPADIPVLARRFLASARERAGKAPLAIAPATMLALSRHGWPGNVRELRNAMEYAAASVHGGVVEPSSLPPAVTRGGGVGAGVDGSAPAPLRADEFRPLADEIQALERQRMREALAAAGGVRVRAAHLIAMPERTFRLKLRQHGLDPGRLDDG